MVSTGGLVPAFGGEVMTVSEHAEIESWMALAGSEAGALADLDGCVARLHEVQHAKAALARLDSTNLRAALEARRAALGGDRQ